MSTAIAIRSNSQISYPILSAGAFTATLAVRETGPAGAPKQLLGAPRAAAEYLAGRARRQLSVTVGRTSEF